MRFTISKAVHLLALGFWFGGAAFFNFAVAPLIFDSFKRVVNDGASDRTAYHQIIDPEAPQESKDALASALAGSAVGPVFPYYFEMQVVCAILALVTAARWWRLRGVHRCRVYVLGLAIVVLGIAWPLSNYVSELRLLRFHPDPTIAASARADFGPWHLASLALSMVTVLLAAVALAMGSKLPESHEQAAAGA